MVPKLSRLCPEMQNKVINKKVQHCTTTMCTVPIKGKTRLLVYYTCNCTTIRPIVFTGYKSIAQWDEAKWANFTHGP